MVYYSKNLRGHIGLASVKLLGASETREWFMLGIRNFIHGMRHGELIGVMSLLPDYLLKKKKQQWIILLPELCFISTLAICIDKHIVGGHSVLQTPF